MANLVSEFRRVDRRSPHARPVILFIHVISLFSYLVPVQFYERAATVQLPRAATCCSVLLPVPASPGLPSREWHACTRATLLCRGIGLGSWEAPELVMTALALQRTSYPA